MSSSFPLSRLPLLPLTEVFNTMNFSELFSLSQCSKKTTEKIKRVSTRKIKLTLNVRFCNYFWVYEQENKTFTFIIDSSHIIDQYKKYDERSFAFGEKYVNVPVESYHENSLVSYWDDTFFGIKTIVFHFMELLKCTIESFNCYRGVSFKNIRIINFIGEIMEKQGEIKNLRINMDDLMNNDLKWILDNVKVTEKLGIELKPSHNFEYSFERVPKIIKIRYSFWVTIENLLSFNSCQVIILQNSIFTNQEMDVFMESWKAGKFPKLEMISVHSAYLDDQEQIAGIFVGRDSPNKEDKEKKIGDEKLNIHAGWDIQRNDGVIGTIKFIEDTEHLQMIVWL